MKFPLFEPFFTPSVDDPDPPEHMTDEELKQLAKGMRRLGEQRPEKKE